MGLGEDWEWLWFIYILGVSTRSSFPVFGQNRYLDFLFWETKTETGTPVLSNRFFKKLLFGLILHFLHIVDPFKKKKKKKKKKKNLLAF
jgi:hypothetical protein